MSTTLPLETLSVAESITGGLLSSSFVDISGSSSFFRGGVIAYSNESKIKLLKVSEACLEAGGVNAETVSQMAQGVAQLFGTDWGIATSGFAEPYGDNKSEAYIGIYSKKATIVNVIHMVNHSLTRNEFRNSVVAEARKAYFDLAKQ